MTHMNPLSAYLIQHKISQNQFAKDAGVSQPTISRYINGEIKNPWPEIVEKIYTAAHGEIPRISLLYPNSYNILESKSHTTLIQKIKNFIRRPYA